MIDETTPVLRGECCLHRALVEQRLEAVENDVDDVKRVVADVKEEVVAIKSSIDALSRASADFQVSIMGLVTWVARGIVVVLVLVAAGRGIDLTAILGGS